MQDKNGRLVREVEPARVTAPIGLALFMAACAIGGLVGAMTFAYEMTPPLPRMVPASRLLPNLERFDRETPAGSRRRLYSTSRYVFPPPPPPVMGEP